MVMGPKGYTMETRKPIKLSDIRYQGTLIDLGMKDTKGLMPGKYVIMLTGHEMHQIELYLQRGEWWYEHNGKLFRYGDGFPMENLE